MTKIDQNAFFEGTSALKCKDHADVFENEARIIAFPLKQSASARKLDSQNFVLPDHIRRQGFVRSMLDSLRYENIKGVEFEQVSRKGEICFGFVATALGLIFVLLGS